MANEISVNSSLQVKKANLVYRGQPTNFRATMGGTVGPTPGSFMATLAGVDVDLSEINSPGGMCQFTNYSASDFVIVGIRDPETDKFYPFADVLPGEVYVLRLSQYIQQEMGTGAGTGTVGGDASNRLHVKAVGAECVVFVGAFDK